MCILTFWEWSNYVPCFLILKEDIWNFVLDNPNLGHILLLLLVRFFLRLLQDLRNQGHLHIFCHFLFSYFFLWYFLLFLLWLKYHHLIHFCLDYCLYYYLLLFVLFLLRNLFRLCIWPKDLQILKTLDRCIIP